MFPLLLLLLHKLPLNIPPPRPPQGKKKTKIGTKLLFFNDCFLAKFSCKISHFFRKLVSKNPTKFDFFPRPIKGPVSMQRKKCPIVRG